jgi:predicted transcriptional regulator
MAHSAFRGCEKRVLTTLQQSSPITKADLRRKLTQGNLPISEAGVSNGLKSCLHTGLAVEEEGTFSITEKGKSYIKQKTGAS